MGKVTCMLPNCRYNSLRKEVDHSKEGICETDILIHDKGWGPQCRGYDEMKECFGNVDNNDDACKKCGDHAECVDFAVKKTVYKAKLVIGE